jgi:hypothetical protein
MAEQQERHLLHADPNCMNFPRLKPGLMLSSVD